MPPLLSNAVLFRMFPDVPGCSWIHHCLSLAKILASQLREPETGREEGGGDTGEEGTHQEVAGKRNYGSLTTSVYTRTSLSIVTKLMPS